MQTAMIRTLLLALVAVISAGGSAAAADIPSVGSFEYTFGTYDFRINRDAVKEESYENGLYNVTPRLANSLVRRDFPVPPQAPGRREWIATARVSDSEGPAAGLAIWRASGGYMLCVYPDGACFMRRYDGEDISLKRETRIEGFSFPADISIHVDAGGSAVGRVKGLIVAADLAPADLKKKTSELVTSVSFVTNSQRGATGSAHYRGLHVRTNGLN